MKAMVLYGTNESFVLEDRPIPTPGPGEAVARVLACGAGLTIHHTVAGRVPVKFPIVIGHEITAEIAEVGDDVDWLAEGDPVTAYYYFTCGRCRWCRINRETLCENMKGQVGRHMDGGYAEFIKLPAQNFVKIPEGLDYKNYPAEVGVISDAIATPYKVIRHARISPMENVAVIGAGGGLGIHMVMMARWAGARVTAVDVMPEKLEKCREVGAHEIVNASEGSMTEALMDITNGQGVDVVVDFACRGSSIEDGIRSLAKAGRLLPMAGPTATSFQFNPREMLRNEKQIMGSRFATKQEVIDSLDLVARGDIWPLVTETFSLEQVDQAHEHLEKGSIMGRAGIVMDT
ncbi:MAG: zinc-binding dehydrogenase [Nitrospinaceae bacterium]|nr:zinc-binding dehydrogenase [Nitrospinaceae bacterium]